MSTANDKGLPVSEAATDRRRIFGLLSLENLVQLVVYAVILTATVGSIKSDVRDLATISAEHAKRLDSLERHEADSRDLLLDLKGELREVRAELRALREARQQATLGEVR